MWGCVEIIFLLIRIYCGFYLWNFCKFQLKLKIKLLDDNGWHLPYAKKKRTSRLSVFVAVRLRGKLNIFSLWFRVYLVFVVFIYAVLWYTHHASSLHIVILRRMWLSVWRRQCTRLLINKFALRVWVCNIQPALQSTRLLWVRGYSEWRACECCDVSSELPADMTHEWIDGEIPYIFRRFSHAYVECLWLIRFLIWHGVWSYTFYMRCLILKRNTADDAKRERQGF